MWKCEKCGEQIEDNFDSCWKCANGGVEIVPGDEADIRIVSGVAQGHTGGESVDVERRSAWGALWSTLGVICLIIGIGGFILGLLNDEPGPAFIFLVSGCVAGLQAFFFAFLINVFTDIRWVLTLIYRKT